MSDEGRFGERYGLACTECGGHTAVRDSRPTTLKPVQSDAPDRPAIRRRRCCDICGHRFTTFELDVENLEALTPSQARLVSTVTSMLATALKMVEALQAGRRPTPREQAEDSFEDDDEFRNRDTIGGASRD